MWGCPAAFVVLLVGAPHISGTSTASGTGATSTTTTTTTTTATATEHSNGSTTSVAATSGSSSSSSSSTTPTPTATTSITSTTTTTTSAITIVNTAANTSAATSAINAAAATATSPAFAAPQLSSIKHEGQGQGQPPGSTVKAKHSKHNKVRGRLLEDVEAVTPAVAAAVAEDGSATTSKVASRATLAEWEEFKRRNNRTYLKSEEMRRMARMGRSHQANPTTCVIEVHAGGDEEEAGAEAEGGRRLERLFLRQIDTHSDEDRMNLFIGRKMAIEEFNKQAKSFKRIVNQFTDLTPQEVISRHTGLLLAGRKPKGPTFDSRSFGRQMAQLPHRFDWREKGALTDPKNQATCGCCWAFAATATLESKNFIRTHRLVALSEQHLLDCDTLNEKCDGGTPWDAFDWVQLNGGQEESASYPYEVLPDRCRQDKSRMYHMQLRGYMSVRPTTEENIMTALLTEGPLAVAVNAIPPSFQDYHEGVYSDPDCDAAEENLRHAMVLVGFGEDPTDGPFWTLRNSWGRDWGEAGHIRVSRRDNMCGITTYAVFPVLVETSVPP